MSSPARESGPSACPWLESSFPCSSLTPLGLKDCSRREVTEYFLNSYGLYELIFSAVQDESSLYKSPDRLRLPLIFYLAHTASVYINKLLLAGLIQERVNSKFETMFELGVDEMSWDDTENYRLGGAFQWPSVDEVMQYRKEVSEVILKVIEDAPLEHPVTIDHPWWAVMMGIEHERIHLETTAVLLNQLPVDMLKKPPTWTYAPSSASVAAGQNELIKVPSGRVQLGKPQDFPSYGWDNEYGHATISVPEFEASKYLVTNQEFLAFVEDGGYQRKELWTDEGWQWATFREAKHPTFWVCGEGCKSGCGGVLGGYSHCGLAAEELEEGQYKYRALFDVMDMPWDWPVTVNYHEMKAFCHWKGPQYRAPTEAEHHRMRGDLAVNLDINCDPAFNSEFPANTNLKYGSPSPVNIYPPSPTGHYDVYGNLWEWMEDHFNGLPGFKSTYLYDDFSVPFYDDRHNVLIGGCWMSTGAMPSRFFRNWFRRHFFQYAGFRYVVSDNATPVRLCKPIGVAENPAVAISRVSEECFCEPTNGQFHYETDSALDQVLQREYGSIVSSAIPVVEVVETVLTKYAVPRNEAVVFGSAGGMSTFLLTKYFNKVIGLDFSAKFLAAAENIQQGKEVCYCEGQTAKLPALKDIDPTKVKFNQFAWVPNEIAGNDLVLFEFANRLNEPKGWLRKLWETIHPQGIVIILTSQKVDKEYLQTNLEQRFMFMEDYMLPNNTASIWKLKSKGA